MSPWYEHNLDPIAFKAFGEALPWYWLNYFAGFLWCWFGLSRLTLKGAQRHSVSDVAAFVSWGWLGMLLGARLGYILLYNFSWYQSNPDQIFALWNGGMSFHGGLVGIAVSCWIVSLTRRVDLLAFTDMLALLIPWPLGTGRICNFINGELPGRPTNVSWAVIFPAPWNDFPRHPSQIYEAATEGLVLGIIMMLAWRLWNQKRGIVSAVFLASYGTLRFFTEFSREPDPQLGYIFKGMTMGQLLCLAMVAAAVYLVRKVSLPRKTTR